jgi:sulfite exporter TauE/SafE
MCGPIAVALPGGGKRWGNVIVSRLLYNLGRSITYALMGALLGLIGQTFALGGYQRYVSIVAGVLLLVAVIVPSKFGALLVGAKWHARLMGRLQRWWTWLMKHDSVAALFGIGLLNGFLPCGLVYVALAGAAATASALSGATYMAVFGLGTIPAMLAASLAGRMIGERLRARFRGIVPVAASVLGYTLCEPEAGRRWSWRHAVIVSFHPVHRQRP